MCFPHTSVPWDYSRANAVRGAGSGLQWELGTNRPVPRPAGDISDGQVCCLATTDKASM